MEAAQKEDLGIATPGEGRAGGGDVIDEGMELRSLKASVLQFAPTGGGEMETAGGEAAKGEKESAPEVRTEPGNVAKVTGIHSEVVALVADDAGKRGGDGPMEPKLVTDHHVPLRNVTQQPGLDHGHVGEPPKGTKAYGPEDPVDDKVGGLVLNAGKPPRGSCQDFHGVATAGEGLRQTFAAGLHPRFLGGRIPGNDHDDSELLLHWGDV